MNTLFVDIAASHSDCSTMLDQPNSEILTESAPSTLFIINDIHFRVTIDINIQSQVDLVVRINKMTSVRGH